MPRHPRLRQAILGLVLLLGQWLAVVHAAEHPALAADSACPIGVHAQGLDAGALAPTLAALPEIPLDRWSADAPSPSPLDRPAPLYRSRAPPKNPVALAA